MINWGMVNLAVRQTIRQFRFPAAVRVIAFEAIRKLLDAHAVVTYSTTGEDRVIDYYVGYPGGGFYVDVGCYYPRLGSNTLRLYKRGWRGICIDANPECVRAYRRQRPRDTVVCAAVSNVCAEKIYTEFRVNAKSSIDEAFVRDQPASSIVGRRRVQTRTLTDILREHAAPARFGLLTVDCEGHDHEVLQSLDFDAYRPRVISVEMHGYDLERQEPGVIPAYLREKGYRFRAYSTMNGYFTDTTQA